MLETTETARRRLAIRAWRRGTREMDLILGPFADSCLRAMDADALAAFEDLLEETDADLLAWVLGQAEAPSRHRALISTIAEAARARPVGRGESRAFT